ncbi:unnamed protein product [Mytilus coruscus]|uniref:Uncharacterized protein n=1 Tax=Mytilus coruscus TaxID=42192 RepID=A0A6J8EIA1_MYTCO|nr:unnamed protein product [Mytilus coruscus]
MQHLLFVSNSRFVDILSGRTCIRIQQLFLCYRKIRYMWPCYWLSTLAHMKASNLKSIPSDILKTSSPQTWHIPRGEKLKGSQVNDVVVCDYNSKSPYRQPCGLRSTLYNPSKIDFPPVRELCEAVSKVDNSILMLSVCSGSSQETTDTKFGKFPKGSALGNQQKLSAHYILNILDEDFPILPIDNFMLNTLQVTLDRTKLPALMQSKSVWMKQGT